MLLRSGHRHSPSLLVGFLALLAVFALTAAACGSDDSETPSTAEDATSQSAEETVEAEAGSEEATQDDAGDGAGSDEAGSDTTAEDEAETDTTAEDEAETDTTAEDEAETEIDNDDNVLPAEPVDDSDEPETAADLDASLGSGCNQPYDVGATLIEFEFEGRDRVIDLYVPQSYDPAVEAPLVLNWHGLGSDGPQQLAFSDYRPLAELHGILVALPTGVPAPGDDRNSWELDDDTDPTRDDLAFANEVLDRVIATACVDESRVYTTGMSNGGYFSARLVCEMSDRIAAAASIAGLTHEDDCEPARAVPYIAFHGVDDEVVPYSGGESSLTFDEDTADAVDEFFSREIPVEFSEFAEDFNCDAEPDETSLSDNVTQFSYVGCDDDIEVTFYGIAESGHTWPGGAFSVAISEAAGLGVTTTEINATTVSWEFFSQYSLDGR